MGQNLDTSPRDHMQVLLETRRCRLFASGYKTGWGQTDCNDYLANNDNTDDGIRMADFQGRFVFHQNFCMSRLGQLFR